VITPAILADMTGLKCHPVFHHAAGNYRHYFSCKFVVCAIELPDIHRGQCREDDGRKPDVFKLMGKSMA
jgi:hypothetical protein